MKWVKGISVFIIIVMLSLIFAQQYDKGCSNTIYSHFFEMMGIVYTKGIIEFMKNFSWALLVLLLFILPICRNTSEKIIKLVGEYLVGYGKATNGHSEPETIQQSADEQKEFQEEKNREISDSIDKDNKRRTKYEQRKRQLELLEQLICEDIQKQNIDNFTNGSKVVVDNDPISNVESLYFDYSYRYKGHNKIIRYVNTLFISGTVLSRMDRLYKYIRIMDDINKQRSNQKFIIELICLDLDDREGYETSSYDRIQITFQKAISNGILALKKYKLENNTAKLIKKEGWVLESSGDGQLNLDIGEEQ